MASIQFVFNSTTDGTIIDTYNMSDADATRIVETYKASFMAGTPVDPAESPPPEPTTEETLHYIASIFWTMLKGQSESFHREQAAKDAAAQVPPIEATVESARR